MRCITHIVIGVLCIIYSLACFTMPYSLMLILTVKCLFQFVWDITVIILGWFWFGRPHGIWTERHQEFHQILGFANVWFLLSDQHYCATEHAYCYDVQLLPNYLSKHSAITTYCKYQLLHWKLHTEMCTSSDQFITYMTMQVLMTVTAIYYCHRRVSFLPWSWRE
jgi:hypothetical protein